MKREKTMKKLFLLSTAFLSLGTASACAEGVDQVKEEKAMELRKFDDTKGFVGPADYFTGDVKVDEPFASGGEFKDYQGAMVHFEAGARTAWHTHPKGQTIYIISGEGRAQTEGEPVRKLMAGDVVWFPANEKHWHGAAQNSAMSHMAIQSPAEKGDVVVWLEQVSDEDYTAEPK